MENNFDEDEKKFFTNNLILNKLGDTRDFGNFYELIHNRKLKVMSFLNKDLTQFTNPDLRPFLSVEHAFDTLLSFHIFHPLLYEDFMFMHALDTFDINKDIEKALSEIKEVKEVVDLHGLACELLLFHETRKTKNIDDYEEESVEKSFTKKKSGLNRRNMVIRLKTTDSLIDVEKGIRISDYKFIFKLPVE